MLPTEVAAPPSLAVKVILPVLASTLVLKVPLRAEFSLIAALKALPSSFELAFCAVPTAISVPLAVTSLPLVASPL